jgi:hypothetical protein
MSKTRIGITVVTKRIVEEIFEFDILPDEDPQAVFNQIKDNPNLLFIDRDAELAYSDDLDDEIMDVVHFKVVRL